MARGHTSAFGPADAEASYAVGVTNGCETWGCGAWSGSEHLRMRKSFTLHEEHLVAFGELLGDDVGIERISRTIGGRDPIEAAILTGFCRVSDGKGGQTLSYLD